MIIFRTFHLFLFVIATLAPSAKSKEWNGIKPCITVRSEAERILGRSKTPLEVNVYEYQKSQIHIRYLKDLTPLGEEVVDAIKIIPSESGLLEKYVRDLASFPAAFKKTRFSDVYKMPRGRAVYRDWKEGFEIWVRKNEDDQEIITELVYGAPNVLTSEDWQNRCKATK